MTGWNVDPSGTWTPETGGVLAEKRFTSSMPFSAPDNGTVTNNFLFQLVTGVCTGSAAAGLAAAAALGGTASCLKANAGSPTAQPAPGR